MDGLDGVRVLIDDILIWGSTNEEHDRRPQHSLERIKANLKLNNNKCKTCVERITFLGERLTRDSVQSDDRQVQVIHEMKRPQTKQDVKWALVISYLARFMPRKSANSKALRSLVKDDTT